MEADFQWRAAALDALWVFTTTALHGRWSSRVVDPIVWSQYPATGVPCVACECRLVEYHFHEWHTNSLNTGGVVAKDDAHQFVKGVVSLLRPTLEVFAQQPSLLDPARGRGGITSAWTAAAAQLQLALLRAYAAIPGCGSYAKDHEALIRVASRPVRTGADGGTFVDGLVDGQHGRCPLYMEKQQSSHTTRLAGQSTIAVDAVLHALLKQQDAVLGPWHVGRNPAEAALHAFSGGPGAPLPTPWAAVGVRIAGSRAPSKVEFVQADSLACQLMAAQLDMLAHLVAEVSESNQQVLVNMLVNAATWGGQPKRAPKEWWRRLAVVGTAAVAALDGGERWRKRVKGVCCGVRSQ